MEMHLILLSGINNEGKNVLFGFGLVRVADFRSIRWVFKRFIEFSKHPQRGKIFPTTIISPFDPILNEAIDRKFAHKC